MPCRSAALLLLFVLASPSALAQRAGLVSFQRLAIPEDVPAHLCSAIAQDARGFLWFGTIGVAVWPVSPAVSWDRAVDLADAALYEAKRAGRDRWVVA